MSETAKAEAMAHFLSCAVNLADTEVPVSGRASDTLTRARAWDDFRIAALDARAALTRTPEAAT